MFGSLSNAAEKFRKECNMPTHKSARELLEKLVNEAIIVGRPAEIDTALKQLRELVEGKKKEVDCTGELDCPCLENIRWNKCVEDIADMIYKEEK